MKLAIISVALGLILSGCVTPQKANEEIQSRWIGRTTDEFFAAYGPPTRSYPLNNGGVVYNWRGGDRTITQPAKVETVESSPVFSDGSEVSTTKVSKPSADTTVTRTKTTSSSFSLSMPSQVVVTPPTTKHLYCEIQLTANAEGIITHLRATADTEGANLSLSRCGEVFSVQ